MEHPRKHLSIPALLAAALLALAAASAQAQQQPGAAPSPGTPAQTEPGHQPVPPMPDRGPGAAEITDQQIERFAEAYTEVAQLRDSYTQQIIQADDPDQATELQQEANEKMVEAVENHGLTVGEYNMIAEAIDRDPELQERVLQQLQMQ
jgi:hypothetical protein